MFVNTTLQKQLHFEVCPFFTKEYGVMITQSKGTSSGSSLPSSQPNPTQPN